MLKNYESESLLKNWRLNPSLSIEIGQKLCQWSSRLELSNTKDFYLQMSRLARKTENFSLANIHLESLSKAVFLEEFNLKTTKLTIEPPPGFSFTKKLFAHDLDLKLQKHTLKLVSF